MVGDVTQYCIECGVQFCLPTNLYQQRLKDHKDFSCPNGHWQRFIGKTDEEKRIEQLARLQRRRKPRRGVEERRLIRLAPGRRFVKRRNGFERDPGQGSETVERKRHRRAGIADIAANADRGDRHAPRGSVPAARMAAAMRTASMCGSTSWTRRIAAPAKAAATWPASVPISRSCVRCVRADR